MEGGRKRQKRHSHLWWPQVRWDGRGWPMLQTTGKHLVAGRSGEEEIPRQRNPSRPHPAHLLPSILGPPALSLGAPTLPARSLGLSSPPRHRVREAEQHHPRLQSRVCEPMAGRPGVVEQGGGGAELRAPGVEGGGRDGSAAPQLPVPSGAAGPASTSSRAHREARPAPWAQGGRQGARGGAAALQSSRLSGHALCSCCCAVWLPRARGGRAQGGRAAGVGRLPRRRWPRECNYEV